jgi:beta-glucosidase
MAVTTGFVAALLLAASSHAQIVSNSEAYYPSPWVKEGSDWDDAIAKARSFAAGLTLVEKVNLTTGVGWETDRCVGNTGAVPRLGFRAFCLQDGPIGVRYSMLFEPPLGHLRHSCC